MPDALELIHDDRKEDLWRRYCGFIDLTVPQFMEIQHQLLADQLELLPRCELGQHLLHSARPRNADDFRRQVPVTTYADYAPYLSVKNEAALPEKPLLWQRTSGRSSEYSYKWVPVTRRAYRELGDAFLALLMFASSKKRGEVKLAEHDKFLYGLAPPPYASGCWARRADDEKLFDFLPSIDKAEGMPFQIRIEEGFKLGLQQGIDIMAGISVMLLAVAERFGQNSGSFKQMLPLISKPRVLTRLAIARMRSRIEHRKMLPRDIWRLKALISTGTDAAVYRERIKNMWGRYPLDVYGSTESTIIALQTWDYRDMTFVPNLNFLEFMPLDEHAKWTSLAGYHPRTLLLDEVTPRGKYVMVVTNFLGGVFTRYMLGDIVEITGSRNDTLNINIPQMSFFSRADNVLDFAGASLTEKAIWQAIENTGIEYSDWVARKETTGNSRLHLYIETRDRKLTAAVIKNAIDKQLCQLKDDYAYMAGELGFDLLEITILPEGAFKNYIARRQAGGSDPAHLKPPHINPDDRVIDLLQGNLVQEPAEV